LIVKQFKKETHKGSKRLYTCTHRGREKNKEKLTKCVEKKIKRQAKRHMKTQRVRQTERELESGKNAETLPNTERERERERGEKETESGRDRETQKTIHSQKDFPKFYRNILNVITKPLRVMRFNK
jgi:hypothetical protein